LALATKIINFVSVADDGKKTQERSANGTSNSRLREHQHNMLSAVIGTSTRHWYRKKKISWL
jgi:hypothetical protein